jgi:hypothetical protein
MFEEFANLRAHAGNGTTSIGGSRSDRRLADARKKRLPAAVATRFTEIDAATLGALVSIQLFTTVLPLIVIGFDYFPASLRTQVRAHYSSGRSAWYTR